MENYQNVELANMEVMDQTLERVLGQIGAQHEALEEEAVEEELDAICLDDIVGIDHGLAFQDA